MDNQHSAANNSMAKGSQRLKVVLVIVLAIMVAEVIGGLLSNSLALLGDAGHMLVDALALGMSLFAIRMAKRLIACAPYAVRWTKYSLNNWYRMAGPAFDASLALEMMGFAGPEAREGRAALVEKRRPDFDPKCVL